MSVPKRSRKRPEIHSACLGTPLPCLTLGQVDRTIPREYKSRSFHCLNPCCSMLPSVWSFRWISFSNTIINDRRLEERIVVGVCLADSCCSRCIPVYIEKIRTGIFRLCETHDAFIGVVVAALYPEEAKLDRTTIVKHTNNKQSFSLHLRFVPSILSEESFEQNT